MIVVVSNLITPCTIKSRSSLLAPAHLGGPGKGARKRLCVVSNLQLSYLSSKVAKLHRTVWY